MAGLSLILGLGFFTLNGFAVYRIITKAGYSGAWMALVVAPFIAYLIGLVVIVNDARSSNFHLSSAFAWFTLAGVLGFVEWIFFLVFAFSEWPVSRQRPLGGWPGMGYPPPPPPGSTGYGPGPTWATTPPPPAGPPVQTAGWTQSRAGGGRPEPGRSAWSNPWRSPESTETTGAASPAEPGPPTDSSGD